MRTGVALNFCGDSTRIKTKAYKSVVETKATTRLEVIDDLEYLDNVDCKFELRYSNTQFTEQRQ